MSTVVSDAEKQSGWTRFVLFFVENKLVVLVLGLLLIGTGLLVMPFDAVRNLVGETSVEPVPVDAIPDIGENQQIVFTRWPGRSPRDIEDQVSYPLTTALLGIPGVRTVRSSSMFGFSSIYVIFEDDVEFYWSRSRVLEKLASLPGDTLPGGVSPTLGPDATALGQVLWYTLEGQTEDGTLTGGWDLHELRSIQDWTVRYALQSVPGVSEVASVGGHVREYQVDVDPEALLAHGITIEEVARAVRQSNLDIGARTLEINRAEYLVRGLGLIEDIEDLEATVVVARDTTPLRIRDVARVALGPAQRRGALDDAGAEAVGGVVVVRYGENPMRVIERVNARIAEISPGLPTRTLEDGTVSQVKLVPFYDRSELIEETLSTLSTALLQQILITIIVVLLMLQNLRSSILVSFVLPVAVLGTFVAMKWTGVEANIMALAGIAIAIGTMVDMGIVFTENIVQQLSEHDAAEPQAGVSRARVVANAAGEVAPAVFTSVLTTVVSFIPVFALTASEGKLFTPLAYTKTFAMGAAFLVALIALPPLAHFLVRRGPDNSDVAGVQGTGVFRSVLRSLLRPAHWRNWALFLLGASLLFFHALSGVVVMCFALLGLARPFLAPRFRSLLSRFEVAIVALAVAFLLSANWMPLGVEVSLVWNFLFVAIVVLVLLGAFQLLIRYYSAILGFCLDHRLLTLSIPAALVLFGLTAWLGFQSVFGFVPASFYESGTLGAVSRAMPGFGREFMPPFDEGSFLYMPTTMSHASLGQSLDLLSGMDAAIQSIPEVDRVVGKLGRAETPLDPAPVSMFETLVTYKPEYGTDPEGNRVRNWRDHIRSPDDIWDEIVRVGRAPGVTSAPMLMPINTRIIMLQSGMRAPMGIKVAGPDLETIEAFGLELEALLAQVPAVRAETVFADRVVGKPYLEIDIDREAIGRYGLSVGQVQQTLQSAVGGEVLTYAIEGRERYPIRVRYMREERDTVESLGRVLVATPSGQQIPMEQLAEVHYVRGPQVIKAEDTFLTSYVLFDRVHDVSEVEAVQAAERFIAATIDSGELQVPAGVTYRFAGAYENQVRSEKRLMFLVPVALLLVFLILYLQFRRVSTTLIIFSSVAVCVAGGFCLLWLYSRPGFLNFALFGTELRDLFQIGTVHMSVAVWIGFIALVGIATDDGVVMSTYLAQRFKASPPQSRADVRERTMEAAKRRVRPCLMTTATTFLALLPIIMSRGRGADVMMPMALPSLGGMVAILLSLFIVPVLYCWVEERKVESLGDRVAD